MIEKTGRAAKGYQPTDVPNTTAPTDILSSHQDYYHHYYSRPELDLRGDKVK
jgi:hypothetical protein